MGYKDGEISNDGKQMRYQTEHKQRTRERVIEQASEAIRKHGPDKIGVAGLMAKAGLTHGGFYSHFASKDELVLAAISHMFDEQRDRTRAWTEGLSPEDGLVSYLDHYLSTLHRDHPEKGCPVAALSSDVGRMSEEARTGFDAGLASMIAGIAEIISTLPRENPESLAASLIAEMVGAMAISRAVADGKLSESILDAARASIKLRIGLN